MDLITSSVLGPVCERVINAAFEEYALVRGVKEEMKNLAFTVSLIKGVLEDAERKQEENVAVSAWLKSLKQILFDAEDVLDEIAADEALRRTDAGATTSSSATTSRGAKVLKLNSTEISELPMSIGTFKHLKLLDLSYTPIKKLPESLCSLLNLQVLELGSCRDLGAWPENMSALINLRHLDAVPGLVSSIRGLGKLTALRGLGFDCGRQKMRELADMDMLRRLQIWRLEEVGSKEEASASRLDEKENLDVLELSWGPYSAGAAGMVRRINHPGLDEEVLHSLKPASNTRRLTIKGYGGISSPGWMDDQLWLSCSSLERLVLQSCRNWEVLPPLGQLPRLKFLEIRGIGKVRRMGPGFMGFGCYSADDGGVVVQLVPGGGGGGGGGGFPSLEELQLRDMEEWEEWEAPTPPPPPPQQQQYCQYDDDGGIVNDDGGKEGDDRLRQKQPPKQQQQQQQPPLTPHPQQQICMFLPRLRKLVIATCPKLRQLPPLPPTLTELMVYEVGLTRPPGWQYWLPPPSIPSTSSSSSSSSSSSTPALRSSRIMECPNLTSPTDGLPRIRSLTIAGSSVQQMKVWLLQYPPSSLQDLRIRACPQLTGFVTGDVDDEDDEGGDDVDGEGGAGGSSGLLEMALLERFAPSLRRLEFWRCENLRSLPPNLRCLSSLESLVVYGCPQIPSLPPAGLPESLRRLRIEECSTEFGERCEREEGADWHLISRIPDLDIGQ